MYKYLKFIVISLLLLSSLSTKSQNLWTLESCIKYAYEHNVQLKQSDLTVKIQEYNLKQSKFAILPNLNGGADYNLNFGRSVDPYTNDFTNSNVQSSNLYLNSSVTLFGGFKNYHTIQRNNLNLMASVQEQEKLKNDISLNIATAYLQILFNKELLKVAEQRLEQGKEQEELTRKLVNAGTLAEGDLLNISAQTAGDELQVINAQNQLNNAQLLLVQLIDYTDTTSFDIENPNTTGLDSALPYTFNEVFEKAKQLPEIKAAQLRLAASEHDIEIARSNYYPKLSLSATYATGYSDARKQYAQGDSLVIPIGFTGANYQPVYSFQPTYTQTDYPFSNQLSDNASKALGLRLTVPIFNNQATRTSVQIAKLTTTNQNLTLYNNEMALYKEIKEAFTNAESALSGYQSSEKAMLANKTAFEYAQKKYAVGLITFNDFRLAQNGYLIAESDFIRSKYEFLFRKSILEFYAGMGFSIK